jgi:hypothetical protein
MAVPALETALGVLDDQLGAFSACLLAGPVDGGPLGVEQLRGPRGPVPLDRPSTVGSGLDRDLGWG